MPDDAVPQWLSGERRLPTVGAMSGAIGGLVALAGVTALYGELPDDDARAAGLALAVLTLLVGCTLSIAHRARALGVAGVVLAAGAVVPLAFLLANDPETIDSKADFLVGAALAVVLWSALYAVGPARGHGAFLGLALFGLWLGALSQTSPEAFIVSPFRAVVGQEIDVGPVPIAPGDDLAPFETIPPPSIQPAPRFDRPTVTIPRPPPPPPRVRQTTTTTSIEQSLAEAQPIAAQFDEAEADEPPVAPAVVSILFGLAYLLAAFVLDGARLRRAASPFVVAGTTALLVGTLLSAPRLGGMAASSLALVFSVAVVAMGVVAGRRLVAWLGAGTAAMALAAVVESVLDDGGRGTAVGLLVVGAAVVGLGMVVAERDDPGH
jgi:hypothetical protein